MNLEGGHKNSVYNGYIDMLQLLFTTTLLSNITIIIHKLEMKRQKLMKSITVSSHKGHKWQVEMRNPDNQTPEPKPLTRKPRLFRYC